MRWWESGASDAVFTGCRCLAAKERGGRGDVGCEGLERIGRDGCAVGLGLGAEDVGARCESVGLGGGVWVGL